MTTPGPSLPERGARAELPASSTAGQMLPARELGGVVLGTVGSTGALVTLGFLVNPLASLLALFVLMAAAGVWLSTSEV